MSNRKPVMAGNWKMFKTGTEAAAMLRELRPKISMIHDVEIVVCPPFTALAAAAQAISGSNIALGGQNLHWEVQGAFTGEVSAQMLDEAGCRWVIIGHSERRQLFGETDETVHKKILAALRQGLTPIACCGETLTEREANRTLEVVGRQIQGALGPLKAEQVKSLVVAYEPVWAIGTGKVATPAQAQEVHAAIRAQVGKLHGAEVAEGLRILYGGSVKPDNVKDLMAQPDLDGALVGGASLQAESFAAIVRYRG
jgi:triosephosphate isomerase